MGRNERESGREMIEPPRALSSPARQRQQTQHSKIQTKKSGVVQVCVYVRMYARSDKRTYGRTLSLRITILHDLSLSLSRSLARSV